MGAAHHHTEDLPIMDLLTIMAVDLLIMAVGLLTIMAVHLVAGLHHPIMGLAMDPMVQTPAHTIVEA